MYYTREERNKKKNKNGKKPDFKYVRYFNWAGSSLSGAAASLPFSAER